MQIKTHISILLLLILLPPYVAAQSADNSEPNSRAIPSTTIVVIFISITFFLSGAFVLVRHIIDTNSATADGLSVARGLDAQTISALPIFLYSDIKLRQLGVVELECAVCLCEFEETDELRLLRPGCCHVFHPHCIDPWLASHVTCPICRQSLIELPSGAHEPHAVINIPPFDHVDEDESNGPDRAREHDDHGLSADRAREHDDHGLSADYNHKQRIIGKFTRSHSTGHSLVDAERFRLNLPEEVQIRHWMNRSEYSCRETLNSMVSPRIGYRWTGCFSMTPPIIHPRHGPVWSPIPAGRMVNNSKNLPIPPISTSDR